MLDASIMNAAGHRVIDISLQRHKKGVKVSVQVTPEIEEFFKRWGGGVAELPGYGRLWEAVGDERLSIWSFEAPVHNEDMNYSLFHTGGPFKVDGVLINLSFIRLVGASESPKEFICSTVMSKGELEKIASQLRRAAEHFYTEYIQPVNLNIFVGVRDILRDG